MTFATGWIGHGWDAVTEAAKRTASALHLGAVAGRVLPDEAMLPRPVWVSTQIGESCTAHMGIRMMYAFDGVQCSPAVPWWAGRRYDNPDKPLQDVGISAAALLYALREHGAAPFDPELEPGPLEVPPTLQRIAAQKRNLDLVPIWGSGDEVVAAVCGALADGLPCGIAIQADEAYQKPTNGIVGPETDPNAGGHAVVLWGYRTAGGKRQFWSPGSWGTGWKGSISGCVWLDESRIAGASFVSFARGIS